MRSDGVSCSRLALIFAVLARCSIVGGGGHAANAPAEANLSDLSDWAECRDCVPESTSPISPSLDHVGHDQLIQLLHRAAAPQNVMTSVLTQQLSGRDLAGLNNHDARRLLNCSATGRCFTPPWCAAPRQQDGDARASKRAVAEGYDPRERLVQVLNSSRSVHPNLLEYARLHARARKLPPSQSNKFLVWTCGCCGEPCSGWGNRILGIVSALMLAIITDRAFLIHWPADACVALEDMLGSEWIDWRMPRAFRSLHSPADQEYLVNLEPINGHEMSLRFRSFNPNELNAKTTVWMRASQGLFVDLWRNPHVSHLLCRYGFNTVDDTYALLSRLLFTSPQGPLAKALSHALADPQLAGKMVIGLQMRFTEVSRMSPAVDIDRFYRAAQAIEAAAAVADGNSTWVLATDSDEVRSVVLAGPHRHKVFFFDGPARHLDFQLVGCDEGGIVKMFVDWWLIREADALVASGDSTFGVTAYMMRYNDHHTRWSCALDARAQAGRGMGAGHGGGAALRGRPPAGEGWHLRAVMKCDLLDGTSQTSALCRPCRGDEEAYACGAEDVCFNGLFSFTLSEHVECRDDFFFERCGRTSRGQSWGGEEGREGAEVRVDEDGDGGVAVDEKQGVFLFCAEEEDVCVCEGTLRFGSEERFLEMRASGELLCSNALFDVDPAPNTAKICLCRPDIFPLEHHHPDLSMPLRGAHTHLSSAHSGAEHEGGAAAPLVTWLHEEGLAVCDGRYGGCEGAGRGALESASSGSEVRSGRVVGGVLRDGGSAGGGGRRRRMRGWTSGRDAVEAQDSDAVKGRARSGHVTNASGHVMNDASFIAADASLIHDMNPSASVMNDAADADGSMRLDVLRPTGKWPYAPGGGVWERMLILAVRGVRASEQSGIDACLLELFLSWVPAGAWRLSELIDTENCEFSSGAGGSQVCYPTGSASGLERETGGGRERETERETCSSDASALYCHMELPPGLGVEFGGGCYVEVALRCPQLGIDFWNWLYV